MKSRELSDAEPLYKVDIQFGYFKSRSWLASTPDGTMVGMGASDHYDQSGKLIKRGEAVPTGLVLWSGERAVAE